MNYTRNGRERSLSYDYLVVGAGLFGSVFACEAKKRGKSVLVLEKRPHIAGNVYTQAIEGIEVHRYGAHIFHTSDERVWAYVNAHASFNHFVNAPVANYEGRLFNLPFNMNTFYAMWGVTTPEEARQKIEAQKQGGGITEPENLEEQAISLVGEDIYRLLIKGYTEKQWGRSCRELPASIIRRLPVRFTYDNNYFSDPYQGIPKQGYTALVQSLLEGIEVRLGVDYLRNRSMWDGLADRVIYTGPIDAFFGYCLGALSYRSVRFETEVLDTENYQGVAVMNFTDRRVPYTRIIEHKHFAFGRQPRTVISREYPAEWQVGDEPYYPVNDAVNMALFSRYQALAKAQDKVLFGGRLGEYRYYDMDKVVAAALDLCAKTLS